ncbi:MAG: peptidoglycan-binding protein [Planctomycetes bacterium]|nr:peptidoglycan-binding protein [Planctomycetota bacterium]
MSTQSTLPALIAVCLSCFALTASAAPPGAVRPRLKSGDSGDSVRILQLLVSETRSGNGPRIGSDGAFGPQTKSALQAFQRAAKVDLSGEATPRTWRALLRASKRGLLGRIDPTSPVGAERYRLKTKGPKDVAIHLLPPIEVAPGRRAQPLLFLGKLAIDADGDGDAWKSDPWGQAETSLQWGGGRSLNPTKTPFFVLPIGFDKAYPGVKLGDLGAVIYRGKIAFAIFGDRGPGTKIGEGSIALAKELGINADPRTGGASEGVLWIVFPSSGNRRPLANDVIVRRGRELFAAAGGRLPRR